MKKFILFLFTPFILFAQIPDYYTGIDFSKTGQELEEDLQALVIATHHTNLVYTPGVWNALKEIDLDPENPNKVLLIYGFDDSSNDITEDRTRDVNESCHTSNCNGLWVREHTYPKSLGQPNLGTVGPGADAHHIRPIDNQRNNSRSNRAFAAGNGTASYITSDGKYYPGDEWKGDVARMMMYMHIRYRQITPAHRVGSGSFTFNADMPDIFLQWNAEDPVSEPEWVRNVVLEELQGNRNPFIDNPYLATAIWGGPDADNYWTEMSTLESEKLNTRVYPNPAKSEVFIKSDKKIKTISLYSMTGQTIFSHSKYTTDSIDVSNLEKGTYLLLLYYSDKTKESKKIMIQ